MALIDLMEESWREKLKGEFAKPYMKNLERFLEEERTKGHRVYPPELLIFNAFQKTPYDNAKVVIVGQDPYHGPDQAHGLSFSVPPRITPPPSLKNIFKEMKDDLGIEPSSHGCLTSYAEQGVLLLNATLTVRHKEPRSHAGRGWEQFTDAVINVLKEREDPLIFVLWGKFAQEKCAHIMESNTSHKILTAAHPSPYSAHNFLGCRHFSKINKYLEEWQKEPIDWKLTSLRQSSLEGDELPQTEELLAEHV